MSVRSRPRQVIEPGSQSIAESWLELWAHKEVLYFLVWRDVKIRYKQTVLGVAWAILQPLLSMVVFSLFFGRLAGFAQATGGVAYPLWVYLGILPWMLFSQSITQGAQALSGRSTLVSKIYFPRLALPFSSVGVSLLDFSVGLAVLIPLLLLYGDRPSLTMLCAVLPLGGLVLASLGMGAALSALNVRFRDFQYVLPFVIQLWMFVTPIIYPLSLIPERWRWVSALNPLTGLIEGFRNSMLGQPPEPGLLLTSLAFSVGIFIAGSGYFRGVERKMADII
jgi:lipopolysaccharide transport system permease protein